MPVTESPTVLHAVGDILNLPLGDIAPWDANPRKVFDDEAMNRLVDSIADNGVLQNIVVRPVKGEDAPYQIVAGERRWRAAGRANLETIPARVLSEQTSDGQALELALRENIDRDSLTPLEEADGFQRLLQFETGLTQTGLSSRLGVSQGHVANALRLLKLPERVKELITSGKLNKSAAIALCSIADHPDECSLIALRTVDGDKPLSWVTEEVAGIKAGWEEAEAHAKKAAEPPLPFDEPAPAATETQQAEQLETEAVSLAAEQLKTETAPQAKVSEDAPEEAEDGEDAAAVVEEQAQAVEPAAAPEPADTPAPASLTTPVAAGTATPAPAAPAKPQPGWQAAAASGERINTTILSDDDDWLFEEDLTLDKALAALRGVWPYRLTSMSIKCLKALTDAFNDRNPDQPVSPSLRLEALLRSKAEEAGFDLDTLESIPE